MGGGQDWPAQQPPAPQLTPQPGHAPAGIQLSCFTDKRTEAPERQRDSLKSQSQSIAELGLEASLPPPLQHTYTCPTVSTACLHSLVSSRDWEKYQFCSSQDLTSEHEE